MTSDDPITLARRIVDLGNELEARGDFEAALARYREAAAAAPNYPRAYVNIGNALQRQGKLDEAVGAQQTARDLDPHYAAARFNLGLLYQAQGKPDAAEPELREALRLAPGMADAAIALADLYESGGRPADCERELRHALRIDPRHPGALNNLGMVLHARGELDEALACFGRAVEIDPGYADAHFHESLCRLLIGDFETGWRKHEWRWRSRQFEDARRDFAQPLWLGEHPVAGKTVLLYADQGLGDTVQFCRYASLVAARGATVVMEVQHPLKTMLAALDGVSHLLAKGEALPAFDYQCPLLSLPLAFDTRLDTIPARIPYLRADPVRVRGWQERLGAKRRPRVGLVWSGRIEHGNDRNRSIALADMATLVSDRAQFVSLQKELRAADKPALDARKDILHFDDGLEDFAATAALIASMDVVITVDTSVAHVAGAMGKPVWILLPFVPDWRWLLEREDSPWYSTARLFRQPASGDWATVLRRVAQALAAVAGA